MMVLASHLGAAELKFVLLPRSITRASSSSRSAAKLVYEFDQYADFFFMVKTQSLVPHTQSGPHPSLWRRGAEAHAQRSARTVKRGSRSRASMTSADRRRWVAARLRATVTSASRGRLTQLVDFLKMAR